MAALQFPRRAAGRLAAVVAVAIALPIALPIAAQERVDYDALSRIKEEGFQRSKVMDTASYLTDVYGPRLTGSPNIKAAGDWAVTTLTAWGLANARLETWGPFGRGWTSERVAVHVIRPQTYPVIAYPKAWTPGTNGPISAEVVLAVIANDQDFERLRGTLKGKIVLTSTPREVKAQFEAPARRHTAEELAGLAAEPDPGAPPDPDSYRLTPAQLALAQKRITFFEDEGAVALLEQGRGDGGTVFVQGVRARNTGRDVKQPLRAPQLVLAAEHYGRIARTLEKKIPVSMEIDVRNTFHDARLDAFNVIAELPGTDKADEIVMLGAHFDSWHSGTGATDNAAGSAVMMEAVRILKAAGLKMRRTVRIALWTGEEQGLLGSRAYVAQHLADRTTMQLKPGHAKLAGYFNVDNGTGAIRGIYLQGNEAVAPIFNAWMEPFRNLGMTTSSIRNTSGTDHLSFDAVGLPGFQFIQDAVEYRTRTHHSNMDVFERIQAGDMMKNAVIVASFVYHTANRDERLPRKPLPPKAQSPEATPAATATR